MGFKKITTSCVIAGGNEAHDDQNDVISFMPNKENFGNHVSSRHSIHLTLVFIKGKKS